MQAEIDTSKPHAARIYDYLLGGKDHFAIDRETAEKGIKLIPTGRTAARENRTFLGRAVSYLVAEAGIRQFLDVGTGLPSANNVHEVAQAEAPESRVVYVDNDPNKPGCSHADFDPRELRSERSPRWHDPHQPVSLNPSQHLGHGRASYPVVRGERRPCLATRHLLTSTRRPAASAYKSRVLRTVSQ